MKHMSCFYEGIFITFPTFHPFLQGAQRNMIVFKIKLTIFYINYFLLYNIVNKIVFERTTLFSSFFFKCIHLFHHVSQYITYFSSLLMLIFLMYAKGNSVKVVVYLRSRENAKLRMSSLETHCLATFSINLVVCVLLYFIGNPFEIDSTVV